MRRVVIHLAAAALTGAAVLSPLLAAADDITVTIKDHKFEPAEITIPANTRVQITIVNTDGTPEEFESHPMKIEKVVPGKSKATVRIGPLTPGRYPFVGEFHESTAKGVVVAK
jgi:plastocyanin